MFELSFGDVDFGLKGPLTSSEIKQLTCNYIYECLLGSRMNILSTKLNLIDLFLSSWRTITLLHYYYYYYIITLGKLNISIGMDINGHSLLTITSSLPVLKTFQTSTDHCIEPY